MSKINEAKWRSLLFIPANKTKFVDAASTRGAQAIILDLEDSIPLAVKPEARAQLQQQIDSLTAQSLDVIIRINRDLINAIADLTVAVTKHTAAIMVPKVMSADHLRLLDEVISQLETERGIPTGSVKIIALIESIEGLENAKTIAQSTPRLIALALGTEDLSLDGGFEPTPENLFLPAQKVIYAARLAKKLVFGFAASIADYSDINVFSARQVQAKAMGFNGALCIHPLQIAPINLAYTPTDAEIVQAKEVVNAYQQALKNNQGVVEVKGKMVDAPVVERAIKLLESMSKG